MCAEIGLSYSTLNMLYQRRSKHIAIETLGKVGDYLGVSVDYLIRGDETPPPPDSNAQQLRDLEEALRDLGVLRGDGSVDEAVYDRFIRFLKSSAEFIRPN